MARYERLYKCRLCDKIFSVDCTDAVKIAKNSALGTTLAWNGVSPARLSNITSVYIMHNCDGELSGAADFVGVKKNADDGN